MPSISRNHWLPVTLPVAVLILVLACGAYMGAYYAMLDGTDTVTVPVTIVSVRAFTMPVKAGLIPRYRCGNQNTTLRAIFRPALWVDQRLRPRRWDAPS